MQAVVHACERTIGNHIGQASLDAVDCGAAHAGKGAILSGSSGYGGCSFLQQWHEGESLYVLRGCIVRSWQTARWPLGERTPCQVRYPESLRARFQGEPAGWP